MHGTREYVAHYRQAQRNMHSESDPQQVIALLLAGAIERIRRAQHCLQHADSAGRITALNGALDIIEGLRLSLDHDAGGEIAARLESLYEYMTWRLVEANLHRDAARMQEVTELLMKIESAWACIATKPHAADAHRAAIGG